MKICLEVARETVTLDTPSGAAGTFLGSAMDKVKPLAEVIPLEFYARTLMLCFDGTGGSLNDDKSLKTILGLAKGLISPPEPQCH